MELVSERETSKSCSACGHTDDNQRVECRLYVCERCDTVVNADSGDRDTGWVAQPAVHLLDRSEGRFDPQEQVANRETPYSTSAARCREIPVRSGAGGGNVTVCFTVRVWLNHLSLE